MRGALQLTDVYQRSFYGLKLARHALNGLHKVFDLVVGALYIANIFVPLVAIDSQRCRPVASGGTSLFPPPKTWKPVVARNGPLSARLEPQPQSVLLQFLSVKASTSHRKVQEYLMGINAALGANDRQCTPSISNQR